MASALNLGEQLLQLLQEPLTDERLDQVEALVHARQKALEAVSALPGGTGEDRDELAALAQQQRALEAQFGRMMAAIEQEVRGSQSTRANLEGFRRLMKSDGSHLLNQRR